MRTTAKSMEELRPRLRGVLVPERDEGNEEPNPYRGLRRAVVYPGSGYRRDSQVSERRTVRATPIPEIRTRHVAEPGRFGDIYPNRPSSGAVVAAEAESSLLAERLGSLLTFLSWPRSSDRKVR